METRRIAIIGGNGYIGSNIAEAFKNKNQYVVIIDRIAKKQTPGTIQYSGSFSGNRLQKIFTTENINDVFLLIGQQGKSFSLKKEQATFLRITEAIADTDVDRVFLFSSSVVYGQTKSPARESAKTKPWSEYGYYKIWCENTMREKLKSKKSIALRLANIYGGQNNKGIIGIIQRALNFEKPQIILNGDGLQKRDYLHIQDLVAAVLKIFEKADKNDTINIASGKTNSLLKIIRLSEDISGKQISRHHNKETNYEPISVAINNFKLTRKYGYRPQYSLKEGLMLTYKNE